MGNGPVLPLCYTSAYLCYMNAHVRVECYVSFCLCACHINIHIYIYIYVYVRIYIYM